MDDDSRQILVLKLVVGVLVFFAIMVFIVIILAVRGGNKRGEVGETTTRRTLSGEVTEVVDTTDVVTTDSTTSSESTTSTTTVVTQSTQTTTKKNSSGQATTKKSSGGGGSSSSSSSTQSPIPSYNFTIISSGNSTSYQGADNSMEWSLVSKINSKRSKKYEIALELRTAAERIAQACCSVGRGNCSSAAQEVFESLEYDQYKVSINQTHKDTSKYTADEAYNDIADNTLLNGNYKYLGVGVYKEQVYNSCVAYVIAGEN